MPKFTSKINIVDCSTPSEPSTTPAVFPITGSGESMTTSGESEMLSESLPAPVAVPEILPETQTAEVVQDVVEEVKPKPKTKPKAKPV